MATIELFKTFTIDCAHSLPNVPEGHKCKHVHGHTYIIKIVIEGLVHPTYGWVADFTDIKAAFEPLKETLDHKYLNDIPGLENPTAEHLSIWIWDKLSLQLQGLKEVWVNETPNSGCVYRGK